MAYDEGLAERIRDVLQEEEGITEKKMFGGLAFMVNGNMSVGVVKEELMIRVGKEKYEEVLEMPHAREMDFTGKPLTGFAYVDIEGIEDDADLKKFVQLSLDFARSLPPKEKK